MTDRREPREGDVYERRNGSEFRVTEIRSGWVRCWPEDNRGRRSYIALKDFHRRGFHLVNEVSAPAPEAP